MPKSYPPVLESVNWADLFINGKFPNVMDVGCGKAGMLFDYAESHPEDNILGLEVRRSLAEWAMNLIKGENVPNAAVQWYSVVNGIDFIADDSMDKIFYLFPDPWTKKRYVKRRAFNDSTLEMYSKKLKIGGTLRLASDVPEVHEYHLELLKKRDDFDILLVKDDQTWELPPTNKEKFCRRENIDFFRIIATKTK
jgi:tRNA (guanine-N7-)-methyltransferase